MSANLEAEFHNALLNTCRIAAEHGYDPKYLREMLSQYGGLEAAKRLINSPAPQYGLDRLSRLKLLHISVEAHIADLRWASLFDYDERREARKRLIARNYKFPNQPNR